MSSRKNIFMGKRVLVTGATGFKGSWLCVWLLKLGANVFGISKDIPTKPSLYEVLGLENKIKHYFIDIRDFPVLKKIIIEEIKPHFIFHLAAQAIVSKSYEDPLETITTNVLGTAHILEILRDYPAFCVAVIITSDKCYNNVEWVWGYRENDKLGGKDIYSASKASAENIFYAYFHSFFKKNSDHLRIATARAGNVIGGGDWAKDRIVPDCMKSWSKGKKVKIRNPSATRPWQHVLEPLSGYLTLAYHLYHNESLSGESFNFGPSAEAVYTVQHLIEKMAVIWDYSKEIYQVIPSEFHEAGLLKLNCDKALMKLNWKATLNFDETVNFTVSWYKRFYSSSKDDIYEFTLHQIREYEKIAISRKIEWTQLFL